MKSMLVSCLIAIALLTSCSKDNPVDPYTDPNTITAVNVYLVNFNSATNDWDLSTKMFFITAKIDHKGNFHKRMFNDNFTKDSKMLFSFLQGEPVMYVEELGNIGCPLSDSISGSHQRYFSYTSDANAYITQKSYYDSDLKQQFTNTYISENGKILSKNFNLGKTIYYEFGSDGLVNREYTLDDANQKVTGKFYFHDNKGFVTKFIDSSLYQYKMLSTYTFSYNSQNNIDEMIYEDQSDNYISTITNKYYYDNNGYVIKRTSTSTHGYGSQDGNYMYSYDSNHNIVDLIFTNMNGEKQMKVIFEYKNE
jgi:hypothetical protein